jgi:O-antigen ligase
MVRNPKNLSSVSTLNPIKFLSVGVALVTIVFKAGFYDPFNSAKLITILIVAGWLFGHLIDSIRKKPIVLKSQEFVGLLIALCFLGFLTISTLKTSPILTGLMGDTFRRNGLFSYISLVIIFLVASRTISKFNSLVIYKSAILTGLVVSFYGVLQSTGNDFMRWNNPNNAMISTLGNPNFASALLAIFLVLAFYGMLLKNLSLVYKFLSMILIALAGFSIVYSGSRQGLLAILFSLIFYFPIYAYLRNRKLGMLIAVFATIISIISILGMLQRGPLASVLYKNSISVRGYYWRAGIEMFKDHPLTGVGVDRYLAFFREYKEVGYPLKYGFDITSSNAHNTIIQLFATGGILVGISYLVLLIFVFIMGLRVLMVGNLNEKIQLLGLISAWIAFQAQSLISIDNIGISIWGWLLAGAIVGTSLNQLQSSNTHTQIKISEKKSNRVEIDLFPKAISSLFLLPVLVIVVGLYRSETDLNLIKNFTASQNKEFVIDRSGKILSNVFTDPSYKYVVAQSLSQLGENDTSYKIIKDLHDADPRNFEYLNGLAMFESYRNDLSKEVMIRKKIAEIDPWNAQNYLRLLILYKQMGNVTDANFMLSKILSFAPNTTQAQQAKLVAD